MKASRFARGAALALVLAAIGGTGLAKDKKDDSPAVVAARDFDKNPYPSTTPEFWAEHSVWPQDPGFSRAMANGGVTTLEILLGSANLIGGRSVVLKNVYSRTVQGMKFPGAQIRSSNWAQPSRTSDG